MRPCHVDVPRKMHICLLVLVPYVFPNVPRKSTIRTVRMFEMIFSNVSVRLQMFYAEGYGRCTHAECSSR